MPSPVSRPPAPSTNLARKKRRLRERAGPKKSKQPISGSVSRESRQRGLGWRVGASGRSGFRRAGGGGRALGAVTLSLSRHGQEGDQPVSMLLCTRAPARAKFKGMGTTWQPKSTSHRAFDGLLECSILSRLVVDRRHLSRAQALLTQPLGLPERSRRLCDDLLCSTVLPPRVPPPTRGQPGCRCLGPRCWPRALQQADRNHDASHSGSPQENLNNTHLQKRSLISPR